MKFIFLTALIFSAMTATKAQTVKVKVTSKCGCDTLIHHVYNYRTERTNTSVTDILTSKEVNDWIVIDFLNEKVITQLGSHKAKTYSLASRNATVVEFAGRKLTMFFDRTGYKYHTVEEIN